MIIAAYCGSWKTPFVENCPRGSIGHVSIPIESFISPDADEGKFVLPDLPDNLIAGLTELFTTIKNDKEHEDPLLCIEADPRVLKILRETGTPYTLCYPQRDAKEIYRQRLIDKECSEEYMRVFIDGWECFMDALEADPCVHRIVLEPEQYLSDAIKIASINIVQASVGKCILVRDAFDRRWVDEENDTDEFWCMIVSLADEDDEASKVEVREHDVLVLMRNFDEYRNREDDKFNALDIIEEKKHVAVSKAEYDKLERMGLLYRWVNDPEWKENDAETFKALQTLREKYGFEITIGSGAVMLGEKPDDRERAAALSQIIYPRLI